MTTELKLARAAYVRAYSEAILRGQRQRLPHLYDAYQRRKSQIELRGFLVARGLGFIAERVAL